MNVFQVALNTANWELTAAPIKGVIIINEIKVPILPEEASEAVIALIRVNAGQEVERDQVLIDVETNKVVLEIVSPSNGIIEDIRVSEGDEVEPGQSLAVVEAMKMENVLKAENKATVSKINCAPGDSLAVDEIILEFEWSNRIQVLE